MKRKWLIAVTLLAAVLFLPMAAMGDVILPLSLSVSNDIPGGPFGTVSASIGSDVNGTFATFTFTAATGFLFTGTSAVALSLSSPFDAPATISTTNVSGQTITLTSGGAGQVNGFGNFNITYNSPNSGAQNPNDPSSASGRFTSITFTVTGLSSNVTLNTLFAPSTGGNGNNGGFFAAAHIGVIGTGGATGTLTTTGFAANGGGAVPIPPSALLLGSGLLGVIALGVRRRKQ